MTLAWTGERCVPESTPADVLYEHVHRYLFAGALVDSKDVLDIGCGEGYGTAQLARAARTVTGVDSDAATVAHAASKYGSANVRFVNGSAADLAGCADQAFDVAVCFEMIEHIDEHERLMASIKRVLRPEGVLVISTPDRDVYTTETYHNPYHVQELSVAEFRALLALSFRNHVLFTQRLSIGSVIDAVGDASRSADQGARLDFDGHRAPRGWDEDRGNRAPYVIGVAGDAALPPLPDNSLLHDTHRELLKQAMEAESLRSRLGDLERRHMELCARHDAVVRSRWWRLGDEARRGARRVRASLPSTRGRRPHRELEAGT